MLALFKPALAAAALIVFTASPAHSHLKPLVTPEDYPQSALRGGHEGTVRFEVTIGTNGRVKECRITESSGHSDLDAATCRIMVKRARFKPARDENGNLVEDTSQSFVTWSRPR